jgi:hypothetical protein
MKAEAFSRVQFRLANPLMAHLQIVARSFGLKPATYVRHLLIQSLTKYRDIQDVVAQDYGPIISSAPGKSNGLGAKVSKKSRAAK